MTLSDCKITEVYLSFRGIPEVSEDPYDQMTGILAESKEVDDKYDLIYRVNINSEYAHGKNLPRDVIVQLTTKRIQDMILMKQN